MPGLFTPLPHLTAGSEAAALTGRGMSGKGTATAAAAGAVNGSAPTSSTWTMQSMGTCLTG